MNIAEIKLTVTNDDMAALLAHDVLSDLKAQEAALLEGLKPLQVTIETARNHVQAMAPFTVPEIQAYSRLIGSIDRNFISSVVQKLDKGMRHVAKEEWEPLGVQVAFVALNSWAELTVQTNIIFAGSVISPHPLTVSALGVNFGTHTIALPKSRWEKIETLNTAVLDYDAAMKAEEDYKRTVLGPVWSKIADVPEIQRQVRAEITRRSLGAGMGNEIEQAADQIRDRIRARMGLLGGA